MVPLSRRAGAGPGDGGQPSFIIAVLNGKASTRCPGGRGGTGARLSHLYVARRERDGGKRIVKS